MHKRIRMDHFHGRRHAFRPASVVNVSGMSFGALGANAVEAIGEQPGRIFVEARRRGDAVAARSYAEEAAKSAPALAWAGQAALEFRCAAGDWAGALTALDRNSRHGLIDKAEYRRQRAVLLTLVATLLVSVAMSLAVSTVTALRFVREQQAAALKTRAGTGG